MRTWLCVTTIAMALACASGPAMAKGCIKGAIVGGAAGHYTNHHGVLGAAAGCVIGRHYAKKRAREEQAAHGTRPRQF